MTTADKGSDFKSDQDTFNQALSGWDMKVPCEMRTKSGAACKRPAAWAINMHGCEHVTSCGQHYHRRLRQLTGPPGNCFMCNREFESIHAAHTAVRL